MDVAPGERVAISLTVNGAHHDLEVETRRLLSDALRADLGLTGTHVGCEHGVCGCCTVLLDGRPVRSCLVLAVQAAGATCARSRASPARRHAVAAPAGVQAEARRCSAASAPRAS